MNSTNIIKRIAPLFFGLCAAACAMEPAGDEVALDIDVEAEETAFCKITGTCGGSDGGDSTSGSVAVDDSLDAVRAAIRQKALSGGLSCNDCNAYVDRGWLQYGECFDCQATSGYDKSRPVHALLPMPGPLHAWDDWGSCGGGEQSGNQFQGSSVVVDCNGCVTQSEWGAGYLVAQSDCCDCSGCTTDANGVERCDTCACSQTAIDNSSG